MRIRRNHSIRDFLWGIHEDKAECGKALPEPVRPNTLVISVSIRAPGSGYHPT
jgi:hypothetical protein